MALLSRKKVVRLAGRGVGANAAVWCVGEGVHSVGAGGVREHAADLAGDTATAVCCDTSLAHTWVGWKSGAVQTYDTTGCRTTPAHQPHLNEVTGIVLCGGHIISTSADGLATLWDAATRIALQALPRTIGGITHAASWQHGLLTAGGEGGSEITVWEAPLEQPTSRCSVSGRVTCLLAGLGGGEVTVWCGTSLGEVAVWAVRTPTVLLRSKSASPMTALLQNGCTICAVDTTGKVAIYSAATLQRLKLVDTNTAPCDAVLVGGSMWLALARGVTSMRLAAVRKLGDGEGGTPSPTTADVDTPSLESLSPVSSSVEPRGVVEWSNEESEANETNEANEVKEVNQSSDLWGQVESLQHDLAHEREGHAKMGALLDERHATILSLQQAHREQQSEACRTEMLLKETLRTEAALGSTLHETQQAYDREMQRSTQLEAELRRMEAERSDVLREVEHLRKDATDDRRERDLERRLAAAVQMHEADAKAMCALRHQGEDMGCRLRGAETEVGEVRAALRRKGEDVELLQRLCDTQAAKLTLLEEQAQDFHAHGQETQLASLRADLDAARQREHDTAARLAHSTHTSTTTSTQRDSLDAEVQHLRQQLQHALEAEPRDASRHAMELQQSREQVRDAEAYAQTMTAEVEGLQQRVAAGEAAVQAKEAELRGLQTRLEASVAIVAEAQRLAEMQGARLAEAEQRSASDTAARKHAEQRLSETDLRCADLDEAHHTNGAQLSATQDELSTAQSEVEALRERLRTHEHNAARIARDASTQAEHRAGNLLLQISTLQNELDEAKGVEDTLRAALLEGGTMVEAAAKRSDSAEQECSRLRETTTLLEADLMAVRSELSAVQAEAAEAVSMKEQLHRITAENTTLRNELAASSASFSATARTKDAELSRLRSAVDTAIRQSESQAASVKKAIEVQQENATLRARLAKSEGGEGEGEGGEEVEQRGRRVRGKEKQAIRALHNEAVRLAEESQRVTAQMRNAESKCETLQAHCTAVEARLAASRDECDTLHAELLEARTKTDCSSEGDALGDLQAENTSLRAQHAHVLKQARENEQRVATVAGELADALVARDDDAQLLLTAHETLTATQDEHAHLMYLKERELKEMLVALDEAVAQQTTVGAAVGGDAEADALRTEHDALCTAHSELEHLHSTLQTEHSTLLTDHSALQTDHSTLQADFCTLQTEHSTLLADHNTLQSDHATLQTTHAAACASQALPGTPPPPSDPPSPEAGLPPRDAVQRAHLEAERERLLVVSAAGAQECARLRGALADVREELRVERRGSTTHPSATPTPCFPQRVVITNVTPPSFSALSGLYTHNGERRKDGSPIYVSEAKGHILTQGIKGCRLARSSSGVKGLLAKGVFLNELPVDGGGGSSLTTVWSEAGGGAAVTMGLQGVGQLALGVSGCGSATSLRRE